MVRPELQGRGARRLLFEGLDATAARLGLEQLMLTHAAAPASRVYEPLVVIPASGSDDDGQRGVDFRILGMRKYARCSCNRKVAIWSRHDDIDLCPRCLRSGRGVVVEQNARAVG